MEACDCMLSWAREAWARSRAAFSAASRCRLASSSLPRLKSSKRSSLRSTGIQEQRTRAVAILPEQLSTLCRFSRGGYAVQERLHLRQIERLTYFEAEPCCDSLVPEP